METKTGWIIAGSVFGGLIVFIILLILLRQYMQGGKYKKDNRIDGKVVVITGANTGIGKETALELAKRGAKIYLACRDFQRGEDARKFISEKSGNENIYNRSLDLSSFASIKKFAKSFMEEEQQLHILINNAGVMACPKMLTQDGFELQIGTNHLGHFLLTNLLLDHLKKSAPSRIVVVSSLGHTYGSINKEDLNSEKSYSEWKAYTQSKLANVLFARHLAVKLSGTGVTTYSLHPGAVRTELARHMNRCLMFTIRPFSWLFMKTPRAGAQTSIYCALDPKLETISGKYYSDCKEKKPSSAAQNDETAEWLWNISENWVGTKTSDI